MSSIFDHIKCINSKNAFENAIKKGLKKPEDYMYMNSTRLFDYFKNRDTRCYIRFLNLRNLFVEFKKPSEID